MAGISQYTEAGWRGRGRATAVAGLAVAAAAFSTATAAVVWQEGSMPSDHRIAAAPQAPRAGGRGDVRLPESAGPFRRTPQLRRIEPAGIFEYMDGAGELYLAYRFDHLDVAEYASRENGDILVELYWMRTSDDAYGLLSGDWGGEPVALADPPPDPGPRACFGAGLLRLWSDDLYARVMATRESEASRRTVLALGRAIAAGRRDPPPPRLAATMPETAASLALRPDTLCFLRSHLVLNSVYFIAQRDILNLGPNVEAVTARYGRARLLLVRYPDGAAARLALQRFRAAYLPEAPSGETGCARIEDGWAAWRLSGRGIALAFEAPDREVAASLVQTGAQTLDTLEASHE